VRAYEKQFFIDEMEKSKGSPSVLLNYPLIKELKKSSRPFQAQIAAKI